MSVSSCLSGSTYDADRSDQCTISHTEHRGVQAAKRYTLDIADKTVSYLPSKLTSKIFGGPNPLSSEYRNALLPLRHGIGVELFLLASAVTVTA